LNYREALYAAGGTNLYADYLHLNRAGNDVIAAEVTRFLAPRIDLGIAAP
jgi:lysophospholipase L1-like esterase